MSTLGAPATTTVALPAQTALAVPFTGTRPGSADLAVEAQRAAAAQRENRDAERTRVSAQAATVATVRAADLGDQGAAITKKSDEIKRARARAQARAATAEKKRKALIKAQGYEAGVTDPREMARQILSNKFGYGDDQFACFSWIISHESGWNVHAQNPSGAYGLPQSLPGSKMASVAADWRDNPATQIIWGAQYMKSRYGSPCGAQSHWESAGNY